MSAKRSRARARPSGRFSTVTITREELIEALARVSHETWRRQAYRDKGIPLEQLSQEVHPHDRERAEDTVKELERLDVLRELG